MSAEPGLANAEPGLANPEPVLGDGLVGQLALPALRSAGVSGLGTALPSRAVTSAEIGERVNVDARWIERRTGIRERRQAGEDERVSDLAVSAGRAALADAGADARDVDLVLVATLAPDEITPATSPLVADALGTRNAAAIDVGAACAGSIAGLALASAWVETGRGDTVLVIGAEILTRFVDFDDRLTAPLFGDGAGAMVVSAGAGGRIGPFLLHSDGAAADSIRVTRERGLFEMKGHETFLNAVNSLVSVTREVLDRARVPIEEIDLFVYHQANSRILAAVADRLALEHGRVFDCIAQTGNTSAASVPLALSTAREQGALRPGMRVLLGAVGAGMVWGAGIVEWGLA